MPESASPPGSEDVLCSDPALQEDDSQLDRVDDPGQDGPHVANPSEAIKLEQGWRIAAAVLLLLAFGTAAADRMHPAIETTFETKEAVPSPAIIFHKARLRQAVSATASAFGLSQILPVGPIEIPGDREKLVVRLRVAADDCAELEGRIGGTCAGHPRLEPMPEQLGITAPDGELETRLEMTGAADARLGQHGEGGRPMPPREWSLTENARETTLTLRCLRPITITVTRLPAHAHPTCAPDGPFFELALENRKPYAPILSFEDSRNLGVLLTARSVEMPVDSGVLSFGDVERKVRGVKPTSIALAGDGPIETRLAVPALEGSATTMYVSGDTSSAVLGDEDATPSLLARDSLAKPITYGAIVTLLITALTLYIRALMTYLPARGRGEA
jgi:hypothetical protein